MVTTDNGSSDIGAHRLTASDLAMREKNRFWFEKPATRFVVYFCVFVTSEILVGITLHWIFHII